MGCHLSRCASPHLYMVLLLWKFRAGNVKIYLNQPTILSFFKFTHPYCDNWSELLTQLSTKVFCTSGIVVVEQERATQKKESMWSKAKRHTANTFAQWNSGQSRKTGQYLRHKVHCRLDIWFLPLSAIELLYSVGCSLAFILAAHRLNGRP